jgi:hypothetical protein
MEIGEIDVSTKHTQDLVNLLTGYMRARDSSCNKEKEPEGQRVQP